MTHYDTLGVGKDATPEEIKAGYRRSAAKAHPDKGGSDEAMSKVNKAYQVLGNPAKKEHYDQTGHDEAGQVDGPSQMLMELFDLAITECDGDVVKFVNSRLSDAADELKTKRKDCERQIEKLGKKAGRVKVKGKAVNFFEILLTKKIDGLKAQLSAITHTAESVAQARKLMDGYESGYVAPAGMDPAEDALQRYQKTFSQFNTSGRFY